MAERLRRGLDADNTTQLPRERVARAVHVQPRAHAVTDEAGSLEHAVPPAVHGLRSAWLLGIGPVHAPIGRSLPSRPRVGPDPRAGHSARSRPSVRRRCRRRRGRSTASPAHHVRAAAAITRALLKGDPDRRGVVRQTSRQDQRGAPGPLMPPPHGVDAVPIRRGVALVPLSVFVRGPGCRSAGPRRSALSTGLFDPDVYPSWEVHR